MDHSPDAVRCAAGSTAVYIRSHTDSDRIRSGGLGPRRKGTRLYGYRPERAGSPLRRGDGLLSPLTPGNVFPKALNLQAHYPLWKQTDACSPQEPPNPVLTVCSYRGSRGACCKHAGTSYRSHPAVAVFTVVKDRTGGNTALSGKCLHGNADDRLGDEQCFVLARGEF